MAHAFIGYDVKRNRLDWKLSQERIGQCAGGRVTAYKGQKTSTDFAR